MDLLKVKQVQSSRDTGGDVGARIRCEAYRTSFVSPLYLRLYDLQHGVTFTLTSCVLGRECR